MKFGTKILIPEHCSPLKEAKSYLKEILFPGPRQGKGKMPLGYYIVYETKEGFKK